MYASANIANAPDAFAVTPGAGLLAKTARALYIGVAGNVTLTTVAGNSVTFANLPAGMILPVECTRVTAATAGSIVALV